MKTNNLKSKEIEKENKVAFKKFAFIMVVALIIGGIVGALSGKIQGNISMIISETCTNILKLITPYATLVITIVSIILVILLFRKSKKLYDYWNGEEEEKIEKIELLLSAGLYITSVDMILSYFFFAIGFVVMDYKYNSLIENIIQGLCYLGGFIGCMIFITIAQRKIIDFLKEMNPEKKGSVYDMKFSKKWEESCDEAEKLAIYKCAYRAYNSVNMTCIILWLFCFVGSSIWNFGIMPVTMVSIICFVLITSYSLESYKLSKHK